MKANEPLRRPTLTIARELLAAFTSIQANHSHQIIACLLAAGATPCSFPKRWISKWHKPQGVHAQVSFTARFDLRPDTVSTGTDIAVGTRLLALVVRFGISMIQWNARGQRSPQQRFGVTRAMIYSTILPN